jgi:hypothetical protein
MRRFVFAFFLANTLAYGSVILVTSPSQLSTSDVVLWSQLGSDQTYVSQKFLVRSTLNEGIGGYLETGPGAVMSAGTDWKTGAGIAANDALLSAADLSGNGGAPLDLSFMAPLYGGGAYIQAAGSGPFTARIQAFVGMNSVLDMTVKSDAAGDAIFLGLLDNVSEITKVTYSLMSAPIGYSPGDFVLDKFFLQNQPFSGVPIVPVSAPEPGTASILALSLLALGFKLKKRSPLVVKSLS